MKISEILNRKAMTISFEFFPPKKVENEQTLFNTINVLKDYSPDFVSITYGAGGSTKDKTVEWTLRMKNEYSLNPMMHLTCVASTKESVDKVAEILELNGIDNILALRGDLPEGFEVKSMDFKYAYQLVGYLKDKWNFSIGVAGYPEGHPESSSLDKDIEYLKMKVDAGGEFVITQLFFDNGKFFNFLDRVEKFHIEIPVLAGVMPILSLSQMRRFVGMCGATIPSELISRLEGKTKEDMYKIGVEYAINQCRELIDSKVRGLHFYTLNKYNATKDILEGLNI
ncbi:methylenetetrahydrofolate reductase [NAD(P)H] [Hippea maritima]|uniref:Methylenetetrahydrofolate reductase n=1 Tax=Hippea maritima (strain ATCC 700847 / DSM 10411 / MH2) TaxID=760142 RepID=F2LY63_HIPMA|nr:methylenetetrahydrofolate reductase [NAD(P)H] [Hippea maritima]AEA34386.1 5,10-methylenetetrahydrofolate reductase [Hippea maritima DSM 10411]